VRAYRLGRELALQLRDRAQRAERRRRLGRRRRRQAGPVPVFNFDGRAFICRALIFVGGALVKNLRAARKLFGGERVDARVLPHVERVEVEAERLDLTDERVYELAREP
jgi:hypothetical protein